MRFNSEHPAVKERLAAAYDRCCHEEKTCATVEEKSAWMIARLEQIVRHLDIPTSLKEFGVPEEDLEGLVEAGMQVQRLLVNTQALSGSDVTQRVTRTSYIRNKGESTMKAVEIKGIIPPIITPMNDDESINVAELRAQVNRQIEGGVHAIFCFGTNGEGYILNGKEKELVLRTVIEETNGRVPVYAGTGCISTKETIEQSKMAQSLGADVLSIITPSFAAASQNELYEHYKAVAEAVDMPIVLYNIPARTGNALAPATVAKLAQIDNIVGAKDSSGNFTNILAYIDAGKSKKNGTFSTLSGNDQLIVWNLLAGGTGGIAGCANVYPHVMASIYNLFMEGKIEEAKAANASIASFRACFKYGNPNTIVKTAVAMLGYNVGKCRAPFNQVPEEGIKALEKVLKENADKGMC